MAKEYPLRKLSDAIELADGIHKLGDNCSRDSAAKTVNVNNPSSGSFSKLVSAAKKYGVIDSSKGSLSLTPLYKNIRNSYTEDERKSHLQKAFLSIETFSELYTRFKGKELPVKDILQKVVVRECKVDDSNAATIANIFVDGLNDIGLYDGSKIKDNTDSEEKTSDSNTDENNSSGSDDSNAASEAPDLDLNNANSYKVHFTGPGINSTIEITEEEDLAIVNATLNKIKKKLNEDN